MRELVDDSLREARPGEAPRLVLRPLRVAEAVAEVEVPASFEARAKGVSLSVEAPPELEAVADRARFVGALTNLVQNAVKFTKPGGAVAIRCSPRAGASVLVEVEDECGGLPPGRVEELFAPFTQRGADRSGLGLGLSISRRAIELGGGRLLARDLPGKGCVFSIVLPARARPSQSLDKASMGSGAPAR
jgi:signal transduction histidine kinase